jgi:aminomethyltransferase
MEVFKNQQKIGFVTSGNYCPSLKKVYAMALLNVLYADNGTQVDIIIRNKPIKSEVVSLPFLAPINKR